MILIILIVICVGFGVWLNGLDFLHQPYRAIFSFTIVPIFLLGMFCNIWLVDNLLPELLNTYYEKHEAAEEAIKQGARAKRAHAEDSLMSIYVALPFAFILSYLWYRVIKLFDSKANSE